MASDHNDEGLDNQGIARPSSAHMYFSREMSSKVRDNLLSEGKDTALGAVTSAVSKMWKELTPEERAPYDNLAKADRQRYERECAARDEEVLRQQEERRIANNTMETETRFRGTTMANTDAVMQKTDVVKRRREYSQEEIEERDERKATKKQELDAMAAQHDQLKQSRVEQAEARLKYLLNQSDIFTHFGLGKGKKGVDSKPAATTTTTTTATSSSSSSAAAAATTTSKRGKKNVAEFDEMDEDEKQIIEEEEADDDDNGNKPHNTILLKQPSIITGGTMRAYQLEGLNWLIRLCENGINGILADEMGLGKTLQSISIVAYMKEFLNVPGPHLIMVPKSTLSNWMNEFRNWCPSIRTLRFHGSKEERAEFAAEHLKPHVTQQQRDWDVMITTYEIVNLEKTALARIAWRYLIIDEAHRLKNEASQFSQTVRLLNTQYRLLLTGTPLQNNLHELWALLNFLLPDVFASSEQFDEWFNLDVDDTEAKQRIIGQLHKILRPFMLRRLKADVEKSLPPKTETILFTGMSAVQKSLYTQVLLRDIDTVNGAGNGSRTAILNIVMQLRKCCNHPYLFPGVEDRTQDPLGDHLYKNCGKMFLLDRLLVKMKERGHRVLIFSQMTRMLDIMEDYLVSKRYAYCRIDGNTSYDEREDRIADYNRPNSDKFIFLLSTRAGGLGINLQTADTVIIYDSDWNPQADLQAQDRAHRIGQKKTVQVFRLITDDSVEVKVIERAQQKLKLDAMVVQQGRLQDKDRKLSKQELLDSIKFGADKIFRSKESTITDADIDLILEEGKKRTEAMNEKLQLAEKGDLYNFKLDSTQSTQVFNGKDYSDKAFREAELLNFIDIGKRERKAVSSYSETQQRANMQTDDVDKKPKLPRHLKLPKMDDWQFYDRERLQQLHEKELKKFDTMVENGEVPTSNSALSKLVVLEPEEHAEKLSLLEEAFATWTRVHFNNFVKSSAKNGRIAYDKISKDIGRPTDEVKRYSDAFWAKGSSVFSSGEWDRVVKQIEKGEKKLEEIQRLTSATKKLISMFSDPWEQLTFRHVGNQGRIFNAMEDRYLLCLTHIHGYGNWDLIRSSIRRCDRFRFDFYIQACTTEALGKRCEVLMRAAEREVNELEKKKQAVEALAPVNVKPKDVTDVNKIKLENLLKEIKSESLRLAQARLQLQALKTNTKTTKVDKTVGGALSKEPETAAVAVSGGGGASKTAATTSSATKRKSSGSSSGGGGGGGRAKAAVAPVAAAVAADDAMEVEETTTEIELSRNNNNNNGGSSSNVSKVGGPRAFPIPNSILPELCKLVRAAGADGINKVVDKFSTKYSSLAKRQIEIKINEIAHKEKRATDSKLVWYIKPQYEHYLEMENDEAEAAALLAGATVTDGGVVEDKDETKKTESKKTKKPSSSSSTTTATGATGDNEEGAPVKRSRQSKEKPQQDDDEEENGGKNNNNNNKNKDLVEPKKFKTSFSFFVKEKRPEVSKLIVKAENETEKESNTKLREVLSRLWKDLDPSERQVYERYEQEDKLRHEKEMVVWRQKVQEHEQQQQQQATSSSSSSV